MQINQFFFLPTSLKFTMFVTKSIVGEISNNISGLIYYITSKRFRKLDIANDTHVSESVKL